MDNQHQKIAGYRDLNQDEIDLINQVKAQETDLGQLLGVVEAVVNDDPAGGRWASLARTHLETGLMFLAKAVARPTNGLGRKYGEGTQSDV